MATESSANSKARSVREGGCLDPETAAKVAMINRGLTFQRAQEQIAGGAYFLKKYDLNY
eukprot:CAMPEP_0170461686 /NCGR_PEP_ID=MMETSP0123-20130129/7492_1 /TAXON_ID=182087 /ORGANISM="Favella ehrenbergii, Strain Fehren 1" /LENGTH=58 /DNA_ID=CAMNT_0010726755 /DNA_START=450 /DNA_END=626 /DNA_ORIENTATION=-